MGEFTEVHLKCPFSNKRIIEPVIARCCVKIHPLSTFCRKSIAKLISEAKPIKCPFCNMKDITREELIYQPQIKELVQRTRPDVDTIFSRSGFFYHFKDTYSLFFIDSKFCLPEPLAGNKINPLMLDMTETEESTHLELANESFVENVLNTSEETPKKSDLPVDPSMPIEEIIKSYDEVLLFLKKRSQEQLTAMTQKKRKTRAIKEVAKFLDNVQNLFKKEFVDNQDI